MYGTLRSKCAWLCVMAAALILAGCGGGDGGQGEDEQSAEPVTLTVWDWGSPDPKAMDPLISAFQRENPKIKVRHVVQPFDTYFTQLRSATAARKGPDVAVNYATPALFDFFNSLQPLDEYVTEDQREQLFGFDNVSEGLRADGAPYAVPWGTQGNVIYFSKRAFRKAGLDPDAPPKTWAQFLAACEKLEAAGITPIVSGWKDGYHGARA